MSSPPPEPCIVCGEPTKNRCSSCSRAGVSLFLCSPAHQQLVRPLSLPETNPGADSRPSRRSGRRTARTAVRPSAHPFVASSIDDDELPFILSASRREVPIATFAQRGFVLPATLSSECARKGKVSLARVYSTRSGIAAKHFRKVRELQHSRGVAYK